MPKRIAPAHVAVTQLLLAVDLEYDVAQIIGHEIGFERRCGPGPVFRRFWRVGERSGETCGDAIRKAADRKRAPIDVNVGRIVAC